MDAICKELDEKCLQIFDTLEHLYEARGMLESVINLIRGWIWKKKANVYLITLLKSYYHTCQPNANHYTKFPIGWQKNRNFDIHKNMKM